MLNFMLSDADSVDTEKHCNAIFHNFFLIPYFYWSSHVLLFYSAQCNSVTTFTLECCFIESNQLNAICSIQCNLRNTNKTHTTCATHLSQFTGFTIFTFQSVQKSRCALFYGNDDDDDNFL